MAFLNTLCRAICSSWQPRCHQLLWVHSVHNPYWHCHSGAQGCRLQWLPLRRRESCMQWDVQQAAHLVPVWWAPYLITAWMTCESTIWACWHANALTLGESSAETVKHPGVRCSQMALLLVTRWQIYLAGSRTLLMLLLDRVHGKTIPTIASIPPSIKKLV